jgi:hypothetical protein
LFGGDQAAPQAEIAPFENEQHKGRLRKYEEVGIYGDLPVRDVVRFRFLNGRHIEGTSEDMQADVEYWYFTRPNKAKDKEDYERHVKAWGRRVKWLVGLEAPGSVRIAPVTDLLSERRRRRP